MKSRLLRAAQGGLVLAVFIFLAGSSVGAAQEGGFTKLIGKGKKAYSVPISDLQIVFEVVLPSGEETTVLVEEGGMAKVGNLEEGCAYALVPKVKDAKKNSAVFTIFRLTQDEGGNESIREVEKVEVGSEEAVTTKAEPKLKIRVVSINPPQLQESPPAGR